MSLTSDEMKNFLATKHRLDVSDLSDQTPLFSTGLLDSFSMVEIVTFVETRIGSKIRFVDLTLENFDSISRILKFVKGL